MKKLELVLNFAEDELIENVEIQEPIMVIANKINVFKSTSGKLKNFCFSMIVEQYHSKYPIILVDDYFECLSDNAKQFVLYHELGHYVKGHLDENTDYPISTVLSVYKSLIFGGTDKLEQEADLYAITKLKHLTLKEIEAIFKELTEYYNLCIEDIAMKSRRAKDRMKISSEKYFKKRFKLVIDNLCSVKEE